MIKKILLLIAISFFIFFFINNCLNPNCTDYVATPKYSEEISGYYISGNTNEIILVGKIYNYKLKYIKSYDKRKKLLIPTIKNIKQGVTPKLAIGILESDNLNNINCINLDLYYQVNKISSKNIKSLKKVGFTKASANYIFNKKEFLYAGIHLLKGKRYKEAIHNKTIALSKPFQILVKEQPSSFRTLLSWILKPITWIIDTIILVISLFFYYLHLKGFHI